MSNLPEHEIATLEVALDALDHLLSLDRRPKWFTEMLDGEHLDPAAVAPKLEHLYLHSSPEELREATLASPRYKAHDEKRRARSQKRAQKARSLLAKGMGYEEVAEALEISSRQVRRYEKAGDSTSSP